MMASQNLLTKDNPGFTDASRGVFSLDASAPALKQLGFDSIPFAKIGLVQDENRKEVFRDAVEKARAERGHNR